MIQRIEVQDRLWVIDADSEWDGVDYPYFAKEVRAAMLDNVEEIYALEAYYNEVT